MTSNDAAFAGSIPAIYDRNLGPLLFLPYAEDMARRAAELRPRTILETAAGTGIVTEQLAKISPEVEIVATDLNKAMLDVASERLRSPRIRFQQADAQSLPFPDRSFDALICQFGVMFFPDRIKAYREALRVLTPGGAFLFNVWNDLAANPVAATVAKTVAAYFPDDPPNFLGRTPYGYFQTEQVEQDLRNAGFNSIKVEAVERPSRSSAASAAQGLCYGSPLRAEIEERAADRLQEVTEATVKALTDRFGAEVDTNMSAHVFMARACLELDQSRQGT